MKKPPDDWYKSIWSLDVKKSSWVESTNKQVDFIERVLGLSGKEKILDLACGYGRHSLELARRGYEVVGVDITSNYIEDAEKSASQEQLDAKFICSDIRDLDFESCFDVVLNMADGAIGYFESDEENLKTFKVISDSLKSGGKSIIAICSQEHAKMHFPKKHWEIGEKSISLPQFEYNHKTKRMLYGGFNIKFNEIAKPPKNIEAHSSIRLYSFEEITKIFNGLNIDTKMCLGGYDEKVSYHHKLLQMVIVSQKR